MKVLVTGGAGYVGHKLVPALLARDYEVVVYDTFWFGNYFKPHPRLRLQTGDIRDTGHLAAHLVGCDAVIHLACISNDPSVELDESLSRTINYEAFEPLVIAAKAAGVKRFIYCSTSSVYGISDSPDVREDHPLVPLTLYNTYKGQCEPLLFKHQSDNFECVTIRPSTICGYSPRQRLDLAVNILTNLAYNKREITVFGGKQMRPNLHIDDMVDCYLTLLTASADKIAGQTFNVGAGNYSIAYLAEIVRGVVMQSSSGAPPVTIKVEPVFDERSYQVNSDKIKEVLGFRPQLWVEDAIDDLCYAFRAGLLPDSLTDDRYFNVKRMRKVWEDVYKDAPPSKFDPAKGHLSEIDMMRQGQPADPGRPVPHHGSGPDNLPWRAQKV